MAVGGVAVDPVRYRAVQRLADELRTTGEPEIICILERLYDSATAVVEGYAAGAPEAIKTEAVTRLAAFWFDCGPEAPRPMVKTGAAALLNPYRVRRAGRVPDA